MANGIINGLCRGQAGHSYRFWVEWQSTPLPSENSSIFSATAYLQRSDGNKNSAYNLYLQKENKYIVVDGEKFVSNSNGIDTRNLKKQVIAQVVGKKIHHDENGNKNVVIDSAALNINTISLQDCKLSGSVTLDRLNPYAAYFNSQPQVSNIEQTTVSIDFEYENADVLEYSIDGKKSWIPFTGNIYGLNPYTEYGVFIRISNTENKTTSISNQLFFKTLPIYVERIEFLDPFVLVNEGEWTDIRYSVYPENASIKSIDVVSSDTKTVIANGKKVYGVNVGFATLNVKTTDGSNLQYSISATVPVRVESIKSEYSDLTVQNGKRAFPIFVISPPNAFNKGYTLASSDESIVSVDGNEIIAVKNGNAIVTATTIDGGFQDYFLVTVVDGYTWYNYSSPPEILNTEDLDHIYENIKTIRNLLAVSGVSVDDLIEIVPKKSIPISKVLEILQNIEYNLDIISNNEYKSVYYVSPVNVGYTGSNYDDIFRWIRILNDMYNMLIGYAGKWSYVLLNDGYPTIDEKKIVIRRTENG